ncbi:MAG: nicotinate phosphoribosyltransferase [Solobacterium sp.]|jgi:nicotinate phosphoribosyltransferase|nr:nicotinate phosphoribosyltransferase [Solobacterium sp.]MCH4047830.1 nicotinate phosphoribosyltransferase [Solobacterium sp.]MCH4075584.1 nicotinate phosphoribosyltransferase [Solobacterium sp.]MCI1313220.1 nicotinate phosphoribosyltransferase [Solobacterium sp.]MCI1346691.1 nicotinate phosphoribosyltransferase [Solobacterium sp.]
MSIRVEPYVPDEDYDNPAMVTDFYEFTMANCLFLHGYKDTTMVFDMFYRRNPDNMGYAISCGQQKLVKFLLNYHFTEKDIIWLRSKGMSEEFCEYLRNYKWKGDVYMLREGTVCYPQVPMVRIECDMVGAVLIETYLLQTMNFHSLIATKATRITGLATHTPRNVMEFGTRRAQGEDAGNEGAYAAVLGGCIGTANCLAEMKYGSDVKAVGTIAHSFIEFFPSEYEAFKAYAETYPDNVSLLLDTYSIFESGLPNLIRIDDEMIRLYPNDPDKRVKSARIDSGDLARGYKKLRKALDKAGKPYIKLVASNSLDEKKMSNMEMYEDAHFDSYGVGENLITSATDPVFGGVYKLVAVKQADGTYDPKMKCSDSASKAIIPGKLMAWRVFDQEGKGQCDIISMDDEVIEPGKPIRVYNLDPDEIDHHKTITPCHVEKILVPHIINGELAIDLPNIQQKKEYIREQLEYRVWESELRPEMPHKHYVDLTMKVAETRADLYAKYHGGKL